MIKKSGQIPEKGPKARPNLRPHYILMSDSRSRTRDIVLINR